MGTLNDHFDGLTSLALLTLAARAKVLDNMVGFFLGDTKKNVLSNRV